MLEAHEPGGGQASFKHKKRDQGRGAAVELCTSHFLVSDAETKMVSTEEWEGSPQGKLGCPKCSTRIGDYNWSGMQCSCGAWVCPAIQVIKSKVDESRPSVVMPRSGLALPSASL